MVVASQTGALTGCHNDAELVADLLVERGFDVEALREAKASRAGILGAYEDLVRATEPGDTVVVFYAGHGSRSITPTPGVPRELRFILPTDVAQTGTDDFRGILAEELSALQWRLTLRTPNVTTILDCCFSARMSREAAPEGMRVRGWDASWPAAAVAHRWASAAAEFRRLREENPESDWFDANPHAVRLVACGSHQRAHEDYSYELGRSHGLFTAALNAALRTAPRITWQAAMDRVRHQVLAMTPLQRPEVEGPAHRIPFTLEVRDTEQPHPVRTDATTGQAWLDGARLHGIRPGDQFLLSRAGQSPDVSVAPVVRVTHLVSSAALLDSVDGRPVPDGSMAHPWRSAAADLGVRVTTTDGTATEPVVVGLAGLPGIGVRSDAARRPTDVATVTLAEATYMLHDTMGLPLYRTRRALDPGGVAELRGHVQDLAASLRLRSLGTDADELPAPVDFAVSAGADRVTDGAVLHLTDRLRVSVAHAGPGGETVHANVLDLGVAGRITVLNQAEPAGITLDPGERRVLGEEPGGHDPGMTFLWPAAVPADTARYETLVAVFSDLPQDLRGLTRAGVRTHGGPPVSDALARLIRTGLREIGGRLGSARYAIRRVTFLLCPGGPTCSHPTGNQAAPRR
ncbi:caspase family protein [Streptomyces phyllanthi]|uniref:Caspase family protein n=1 Tax=Streptomyces phyllanthi TaxID=1803180 RepID=A0A5N8VXU3_9ACTN|nr:caspase family protein [Streptomyces phyllanthi]